MSGTLDIKDNKNDETLPSIYNTFYWLTTYSIFEAVTVSSKSPSFSFTALVHLTRHRQAKRTQDKLNHHHDVKSSPR